MINMQEASVRTKKMASVIQQELAMILRREINDPRLSSAGMITISQVELAGDHRNATVHVAFMGSTSSREETKGLVNVLNNAAPFIRNLLVKRLAVKVVPRLYFRYDSSFDHAAKILEAMHSIQA